MPIEKNVFVRLVLAIQLVYLFGFLLLRQNEVEILLYESPINLPTLTLVAILGALAALSFALGFFVSISALTIFVCMHVSLFALPIIKEIQYPYFSILLVIFALAPKKTPLQWQRALFFAVYLGFTLSGISKLFYAGWFTGTAVKMLCLKSPLALSELLCAEPQWKYLAIFPLFVETASLPMALWPKTRLLTWTLNTLLHCAVLFIIPLWPVSFGVLSMQLFLFEPSWLKTNSLRATTHRQ